MELLSHAHKEYFWYILSTCANNLINSEGFVLLLSFSKLIVNFRNIKEIKRKMYFYFFHRFKTSIGELSNDDFVFFALPLLSVWQ